MCFDIHIWWRTVLQKTLWHFLGEIETQFTMNDLILASCDNEAKHTLGFRHTWYLWLNVSLWMTQICIRNDEKNIPEASIIKIPDLPRANGYIYK